MSLRRTESTDSLGPPWYIVEMMDRVERATLICIGALLIWQLFIPPVTGLSNGGDFGKVAGFFNLGAPEQEFHWAATVYRWDPGRFHWWSEFYTSEILLARVAVSINSALSKTPTFDIRCMGAVHGFLFFLALVLLLPLFRTASPRRRIVIGMALAVVACDRLYALTFNTFYTDAAAIALFPLTIVLFLRVLRWRRSAEFAAFVLCAALFLTAKSQHALLGLPMAVVTGYALARTQRPIWAGIAPAVAVAAVVFSLWGTPRFYKWSGVYSTIFWTILPSSQDVSGDLAALGLDESFRPYIGTHGYSPDGGMAHPEFVSAFQRRTSYGRLASFYMSHPAEAWRIVQTALDEAGRQQPTGGNFDMHSGMPPDSESRSFAPWSALKRHAFYHRGLVYLLAFLAISVAFLYCAYRSRGFVLGCGLVSMAALDLGVSTLADVLDPIRHLLLFTSMLDVMVVGALILIAGVGPQPATAHSRVPPGDPAAAASPSRSTDRA